MSNYVSYKILILYKAIICLFLGVEKGKWGKGEKTKGNRKGD